MHPGCGIQLAYKIIKDSSILKPQKAENAKIKPVTPQLFVSPSVASHLLDGTDLTQIAEPSSAPSGSVVISDDLNAREHVQAICQAKDVLYICINTSGKQLAKQFGIGGWSTTTSIAFYDDLINKLQKAIKMTGLRFIEILTPCPKIWKSEPANTVEVARQSTETGLWPIYELNHGKFTINYKPHKLAGTEALTGLQKMLTPDKLMLEKSWHLITMGKPFESEI